MTDFTTWPFGLGLTFLLAPFIFGAIGLGIDFHIAGSRHFKELCVAFQNSPGLVEDLKYWSTISLRTRAMVVAGVTPGVVFPSLVVRRGWLNADDCKNCPLHLKRRLQISFWCNAVACTWLLAGWALIELSKQ